MAKCPLGIMLSVQEQQIRIGATDFDLAMSVMGIDICSHRRKHDMTTDWVPAQISFDMQGGRILDTAHGILIGLRRCSSDAAFDELLGAAQRHGLPVFLLAWALVHLAGGGGQPAQTFSAAQSAARHEWGKFSMK